MALRTIYRGMLRDLGRRRLPSDELAEKVVAQAILAHLERCGWRLEHKPLDGAVVHLDDPPARDPTPGGS